MRTLTKTLLYASAAVHAALALGALAGCGPTGYGPPSQPIAIWAPTIYDRSAPVLIYDPALGEVAREARQQRLERAVPGCCGGPKP